MPACWLCRTSCLGTFQRKSLTRLGCCRWYALPSATSPFSFLVWHGLIPPHLPSKYMNVEKTSPHLARCPDRGVISYGCPPLARQPDAAVQEGGDGEGWDGCDADSPTLSWSAAEQAAARKTSEPRKVRGRWCLHCGMGILFHQMYLPSGFGKCICACARMCVFVCVLYLISCLLCHF
jgi:hypothetical protein